MQRLVLATSISTSCRESKGLWDYIIKHSVPLPHALSFVNLPRTHISEELSQLRLWCSINMDKPERSNLGELKTGDGHFEHFDNT